MKVILFTAIIFAGCQLLPTETHLSKIKKYKMLKMAIQKKKIAKYILKYAKEYELIPKIVAGVVWQESKGDHFAVRFEPLFYEKYIKNKPLTGYVPKSGIPTEETERHLRSYSFGLMQIMGATARDFGYSAQYLTQLVRAKDNIRVGCLILKTYIDRAGSIKGGLLRYNGGGDPSYPDKIMIASQSHFAREVT